MLEMKPEVRREWCKALRSGEYEQAHGEFRTDPPAPYKCQHCCLAVLTDLYVKAGNPEEYSDTFLLPGVKMNVWNNGVLALPVVRWAGLKDTNPMLGDGETAVGCNDHLQESFAEIADRIDDGEGK